MLAPGTRLGPYEVLSSLGAGGMGEVYLARDVRLGRELALKLLPNLDLSEETAARFLREARAASALNHPNIVTIFDVGEDRAGHFIAMELVRGRTLRSAAPPPLELRFVADVGAQTARALDVAHGAGVVHRDVKPDNIMVRDDGLVKVLDFGIARFIGPRAGEGSVAASVTGTGLIVGTVRYMSPEQACGDAVGPAADIFSLGLTLYELATGVHPFAAKSDLGLLAAIIGQAAPLPSRVNGALPTAFDALVLAMLEKEPARRPSAAEVSQALTALVTGRAGAPAPAPDEHARHTVGRRVERAVLRATFDAASGGRGSLLCVAGEAGMGKTTLVEDFVAELRAAGARRVVARGHCSERLAGAEAYLPILEMLEDLLRGDTAGLTARTMRAFAPGWYHQVASGGPDGADAAAPLAPSPERLTRELAGFFQELCRSQTVVLFLDDLHWADVATVDFLGFFAGRLGSSRLLIVATYRPSELLLGKNPFVSLNRDLQARGLSRELRLGYLTRDETAEYVALEFPRHRFPRDFVEMVHAKTEGSPLFMVDVLRYLREEEILRPEPDGWALARGVPEIERELPASVRSMIQRKIDQLEDADRRLLATASVQGYQFDSAAVAAVLGDDPAEVEERLERLETVNAFVRRAEERELPDGTLSVRYHFAHVLYQNAFYASLPPTRKANLSAAFARALLGFYGERSGEIAGELALLFETARDPRNAAAHFAVAAHNASRVFANEAVASYGQRGLELVARMPESPERAALELQLRVPLAFALRVLRGYATAEPARHMQRARELCQQLGGHPMLPIVLYGIFAYYVVGAELDAAREVAEELIRLGEAQGDVVTTIVGRTALGIALVHLGEVAAAHEIFELAIADHDAARSAESRARYNSDPGMFARAESMRTLWLLGHPERAAARADETLALAQQRQAEDRVGLAFTLLFVAFLHQLRGDAEATLAWADTCIAYCNEHGIAQERAWATPVHAWALSRVGRVEEGVAELRASLETHRGMRSQLLFPYYGVLLADALLSAGRPVEARAAVDEGIRVMHETKQGMFEAELLRLAGEVRVAEHVTSPDDGGTAWRAEAEQLFRDAIAAARRRGTRALELRAALSLARLQRSLGEWEEARSLLAECCASQRSDGDSPDLREATSLLAVGA